MFKRSHYIAFTIALVVAILFLNVPSQTAVRLKMAIGGLFVPLFGAAGGATKALEAGGLRALPKGTLVAELEQLRKDNAELKLKAIQSQEVWRQNDQLRAALIWQKTAAWRPKLANVIVRDPANWWRTLQIDLGSRAGVVTNLPVVSPEGLIGRVDQVGLNYARVVLIGDPNCRVAAVVENKERDEGVIVASSTSVPDESIVQLTYLPRQSRIEPGQRVVTSGLSGVYPKGIPIGYVIDTHTVGFDLYLEARVKLAANLRHLEHVWVLFP
jgi:rod shape-determining protein MreC